MAEKTTEIVAFRYEPHSQIASKSNLKLMANMDPQTLSNLLPRDAPVKRLIGEIVQAASTNPMLLQCTQMSMVGALVNAAVTGLHIGGPMQQAAIVPRRIKGVMTACFEPMYKGFVSLAHKGGGLHGIQVGVIYANETYDVQLTRRPEPIYHKPMVTGDRGPVIGYYTVLTMKGGALQATFMRADEVKAIELRSKAASKGFSPWKSDPVEMGKKTVLKLALKVTPQATEMPELAYAIAADNESLGFDDIPEPGVRGNKILDSAGVETPQTAEDGQPLPAKFQ